MNSSEQQAQNTTTLWNPVFIGLFVVSALLNLCLQMNNSMLSLYANSIGAPANQIGTLMSLFALSALLVRFVAGPAMNAYDMKILLQGATLCFAIAYLGFGLAPVIATTFGIKLISVLMLFRLIQGIGNAFGNSCMTAIVSDFVPRERFSSGIAIFTCSQTVAQAIGPTVGVLMRDLIGYNASYIVNAVLMIASIILVALLVHTKTHGSGKLVINLDNMIAKEALVPAVVTFLINIGFTAINAFLLVYAEERDIAGASLYFTAYAVVLLATRPFIGKLVDKYGFVRVGVPALFLTAVSLFMIGYSSNLPMLLLCGVVNACGYGAVQPAIQSICMMSVAPERRGSASSTNYIAMDAGTLVGPYICGLVAASAGYTPLMWSIVTIPVLVGIVFVLVMRRHINHIEQSFEGVTS